MVIYLINIFLIFVWEYILLYENHSDKNKKIYCTIIALQWIILSGFRDWSIGADTMAYGVRFQNTLNTSWSDILSNIWNYLFNGLDIKDPGYSLVEKVFQIFFKDYQMFLVFIAVLFTGLMARWIYKYSSMPGLSFLLYSTLFYAFYAVTGHRQTIATALVVFIGYELAKERKFFRFALIIFIAFLIHKSSVVFVLFYLIGNIKITPIYTVIVSVLTVALAILNKRLYGPIAIALGFDEAYVDYAGGGAGVYATVLLLLCFITFLMYPWISKRREDSKFLYNMLFLTTASSLLIYGQMNFMRIQQYYSLIIMITTPEIVLSFKKENRPIIYLAMAAVLILHLIQSPAKYSFFFI